MFISPHTGVVIENQLIFSVAFALQKFNVDKVAFNKIN